MRIGVLTIGALALFAVGCGAAEDDRGGTSTKNPLVGTWLSSGADMAKGFNGPPLNFVEITVVFNDNGTYDIDATNTEGGVTEMSGTWSSMASSQPGIFTVVQNQTAPNVVTSEGIYQIDGDRMTFEIIQTQPSVGATPPTPEDGFGSTQLQGKKTDVWVQKYARQ